MDGRRSMPGRFEVGQVRSSVATGHIGQVLPWVRSFGQGNLKVEGDAAI
jgi:hypothetical protein